MFIFELYDSLGEMLSEGDIVRVIGNYGVRFYSEVKYLDDEQVIAPFHTFSYHRFEKVHQVPDGCTESDTEERYKIWIESDPDKLKSNTDEYLASWRVCEHNLERRIYRISRREP